MTKKNSAYYFLAYDEYLKNHPNAHVTDIEFRQWYATERLKELELLFDKGNKQSLMDAIYICASCGLPMPGWVALQYSKAWADIVVFAKHKSWDNVFGLPYPKGGHINSIRKERRLKIKVFSRIEDLVADGMKIDESLFNSVGKEFAICKTLASEYYYSEKHRRADFREILKTNGIT